MAIKQGKYRPPTNNYNDVIHFETDSEMVIMGDGSKLEDKLKQMENNAYDAGGSGNSYTVAGLALVDNGTYVIVPNHSNTGATTLNGKGIKKFNVDSDAYVDLEEGDVLKNTPIQLVWDSTNDFFVFAPKTGASGGNYEKLGYKFPFVVQLADGNNSGFNSNSFPRAFSSMCKNTLGTHICTPYIQGGSTGTPSAQCGLFIHNVETGINSIKTAFSSLSASLVCANQSFDDGSFFYGGTSGGTWLARGDGNTIAQDTRTSRGYVIYFKRSAVIDDYMYFAYGNQLYSMSKTNPSDIKKATTYNVAFEHLIQHKGKLYNFKDGVLDSQILRKDTNPSRPDLLVSEKVIRLTRAPRGIAQFIEDGEYIYLASELTHITKMNSDGASVYNIDLSHHFDTIYGIEESEDKLYVMGYGAIYPHSYNMGFRQPTKIMCLNKSDGSIVWNIDSGLGLQGTVPFCVNNSIVQTVVCDVTPANSQMQYRSIPKVIMENILSKKDLIKELKK